MFSKACEYGIRALTIIAKYGEKGQKLGVKEICRVAKTPESFTAKILQNMVKRGILSSQKGPAGGFYLSRSTESIRLYDIVEAIDGLEMFYKCGLGLSKCDVKNPCPIHNDFETVRTALERMCLKSTLSVLVDEIEDGIYQR